MRRICTRPGESRQAEGKFRGKVTQKLHKMLQKKRDTKRMLRKVAEDADWTCHPKWEGTKKKESRRMAWRRASE